MAAPPSGSSATAACAGGRCGAADASMGWGAGHSPWALTGPPTRSTAAASQQPRPGAPTHLELRLCPAVVLLLVVQAAQLLVAVGLWSRGWQTGRGAAAHARSTAPGRQRQCRAPILTFPAGTRPAGPPWLQRRAPGRLPGAGPAPRPRPHPTLLLGEEGGGRTGMGARLAACLLQAPYTRRTAALPCTLLLRSTHARALRPPHTRAPVSAWPRRFQKSWKHGSASMAAPKSATASAGVHVWSRTAPSRRDMAQLLAAGRRRQAHSPVSPRPFAAKQTNRRAGERASAHPAGAR